ncbi:hypothetical protein EA184_14925 [Escherichia coli]|uniref:hypothetical protein n=1 Tax=Escherichia coli TaxID=562 RepID=UPI00122E1987|nr:hypothetical protein [Escherichia coli]KAA1863096.1 hypothetical protein EA184_14925 [Escherichia coli]HAK9392148.1 hypothetical protein [Escherichia coli]
MKLTLFKLHSNSKDYSSFIQTNWNRFYETIQYKAMHEQKWKPFNIDDFVIPEFELDSSDTGKKNFQHDISATSKPFIVLSENAVEALKDILESRGQFLPIITPSKRKKFIGYYPTNAIYELVDLEKSGNNDLDRPFTTKNLIFRKEVMFDEYLFCIGESRSCVLITEKFKERVEQAGLKGFDFNLSKTIVTIE